MSKIVGVIAAGGFASRIGWPFPKSLVQISGISLLEWTIITMKNVGIEEIVVFNNRHEYDNIQLSIANRYKHVQVVKDHGVKSTFELVLGACRLIDCDKVLFQYGHAPRANEIMKQVSVSASILTGLSVNNSSRKDQIRLENKLLEPPFMIDKKLIEASFDCKRWSDLFTENSSIVTIINSDEPAEFNDHFGWFHFRNSYTNNLHRDDAVITDVFSRKIQA